MVQPNNFDIGQLLLTGRWVTPPTISELPFPKMGFLVWNLDQQALVNYVVMTKLEGYLTQLRPGQPSEVADIPYPIGDNFVAVLAQPVNISSPQFLGYFEYEGGMTSFLFEFRSMTLRSTLLG